MDEEASGGPFGGAAGAPAAEPEMRMAKKMALPAASVVAGLDGAFAASKAGLLEAMDLPSDEGAKGRGGGDQVAATRSWFPETFLFEPIVKTDATGSASFEVVIPDRLTTWRVLALAHSKEGAQAGNVTSFLGTLPAYVDPIAPPFLMAADRVALPIQVVNTTEQAISSTLILSVEGAALVRAGGVVDVPARGSVVRYAELSAPKAGTLVLRAALGATDAVEKTIPVLPTGEPKAVEKSGTLAAPRTFAVELPADTDPESARARLSVFPGALAVLRSELSAGLGRGGVSDDAYLLLLSGRAKGLLEKLGGDADDEWLRRLRIVATQRAIAHARLADPATAALLSEAALAHSDNPVLARLGERLSTQLAGWQRPDGTFQGATGWTLQRLMVATADAVRAIRASGGTPGGERRARAVVLKANGAFERNLSRVEDPYTASFILASRAVEGSIADTLAERIEEAITTNEDGSKLLPVPDDVLRPDGSRPTAVEATALAALALADRPSAKVLLPDLGATILSAYRPSSGFGDGYTNLVALRAVLEIFDEPLPPRVGVEIAVDGRPVAKGELSGAALSQVLVLEGPIPSPAGAHEVVVRADPPVPGLGFSMAITHYIPWSVVPPDRGLDLSVDIEKDAKVGHPVGLTLRAIAPAGMALRIRQALPAGVQIDRRSFDQLVSDGTVLRYETEDGAVSLDAPARDRGQAFTVKATVIPTLAGTLHTSASSVEPLDGSGEPYFVPPAVWIVAR
jgi:hypothetical protein